VAGTQVREHLVAGGLPKLEPHIGHSLPVAAQQLRHQPGRHRVQERQPHGAPVRVEQTGDAIAGQGQFGQAPAGVFQQDLAVPIQPQPPVDPVEQWCAEPPLQSGQRPGQGRLGHVEPGRGLGHVLGLREDDVPLQLVDGHLVSIDPSSFICASNIDDSCIGRIVAG
jgi:hypothetical protein